MRKLMAGLRGKLAANMAQRGMEPDMADRASQQVFRGAPNVIRRALDKFDRARGMDGGMRMQPPTPVNRPEPDELVYKKGGSVKESKAMMKKEVAFMKKKGAPKSMIRHEEKEAGMKKGVKKMFGGGIGAISGPGFRVPEGRPGAQSGAGGMGMRRMAKGGMAKSGGSFRRAADGVASKGKTKGKMVKMNKGGYC